MNIFDVYKKSIQILKHYEFIHKKPLYNTYKPSEYTIYESKCGINIILRTSD